MTASAWKRGLAAPYRWFRPRVRSHVFDGCVAAGAFAVSLTSLQSGRPPVETVRGIVLVAVLLATCSVLLARRSSPIAVLVLVAASDVAVHLAYPPVDLQSVPMLVGLYTCGRYLAAGSAWRAAGCATAVELAALPFQHSGNVVAGLIISVLLVALGQYVRLRAELAVRRRAAAAQAAVRTERRRIARELHDVVAHHISVMSVLMGAARATMTANPEQAADALVTAERTAREALAEMRRLLAVLRADEIADAEPGGAARAAQVPELVAAVRQAGVRVGLTEEGVRRELPAAVDLAVYRIVQEALTNTRKHAPGAAARVRVGYGLASVDVEVVDDGVPAARAAPDPPVSGYGLGGMAERVALCGGRLEAGPRTEGGFRVYAWMPAPLIAMDLPDAR